MYVVFFNDLAKPRVAKTALGLESFVQSENLGEDFSAFLIEREADLNKVPAAALVALYNSLQPKDKQITKFTDRATASRRVFAIIDKAVLGGAPAPAAVAPKVRKQGLPASGPCSPAKGRRLGIGARMAELLKAGKTTDEVLEVIKSEFPQSRATNHDVSIIRRKHNLLAPTSKTKNRNLAPTSGNA